MHRIGKWATLLQLCLGAGVLAPVAAQTILNQNTQSFPPRNNVTVANQYLRLDMGVPEIVRTLRPGTGTPPGPPTDIGFSNFRGGRVLISTVQGDPFTGADDGLSLVGGGAWSTYATVRLGDPGLVGATTSTYEIETLQQPINDPSQDIIVSQAEASGSTVQVGWQIRQGHTSAANLQSRLTTVNNGGLAGATTEPVMVVQQSYRLVRDMVRIEVACTNVSGAEQVAGVEIFVDPQFGAGNNDGQPFFVGDVRQGVTREFLFPSANINDEAGLREVPDDWRSFDDQNNPGVILGGVWDNGEIRTTSNTAGVPQQVAFVNAALKGSTPFGYTPVNLDLQGENWGVLARWTGIRVSPNQTRRFITYFGLAGADSDFDSPYVLSVEAPFSLALATGDDPGTATTEAADHSYRTPNPFTLRAFVNNTSTQPLSNIAVSVALPDGFSLTDPTDRITKTIATVPSGTEQQVSWSIRSATTQSPGVRTITVSSSAGTGLNSKVIEREIGIPALPQLTFPSLTRRLDMLSVPYDFQNQDIEHVLGSLGTIGVTGGGNAAVARYNPSSRAYAFFPDPFITSLLPGYGFWLFNGSLADIQLPSDRIEIPATQQVGVSLNPDWNQIGCPYTVPTRLFDTQVITSDNAVRTFQSAVNAGIIRPVLYEYSPNQVNPTAAGTYTFSGDSNTLFNPWRGYWIRTLQTVSLVYNATALIGPFRSDGEDFLRLRNGWEISLQANAGERSSQVVALGQDAGSQDTYDSRDVDYPPELGGGVRLAVLHSDWGRNAGAYLRDIRGGGRTALRWQLQADAPANESVNLRWNLRQAPADVQFTLVDLQTGARRHMRTTSGYSFQTGAFAESRAFEVVAERRSRPSLAIPSMQAVPGRGRSVAVSFTLTADAEVTAVIESPTGRRVRTLAVDYPGVTGQNAIGWDGRDDEGRAVPSGQYRCRVLVHTADGQRAIAERIVVVNR